MSDDMRIDGNNRAGLYEGYTGVSSGNEVIKKEKMPISIMSQQFDQVLKTAYHVDIGSWLNGSQNTTGGVQV